MKINSFSQNANSQNNIAFGTLRVKLPYDQDKKILKDLKTEFPKGTNVEFSDMKYQFRDTFHRYDINGSTPENENLVSAILKKFGFDHEKV